MENEQEEQYEQEEILLAYVGQEVYTLLSKMKPDKYGATTLEQIKGAMAEYSLNKIVNL